MVVPKSQIEWDSGSYPQTAEIEPIRGMGKRHFLMFALKPEDFPTDKSHNAMKSASNGTVGMGIAFIEPCWKRNRENKQVEVCVKIRPGGTFFGNMRAYARKETAKKTGEALYVVDVLKLKGHKKH